MKKKNKKLKHYVIVVDILVPFSTLKDVEAENVNQAIQLATKYATKELKDIPHEIENWTQEYPQKMYMNADIDQVW